MKEILTLLFDQTEKVVAWAGMVVLVFAVTSMASCTKTVNSNSHKTFITLVDKGYHPVVINCVMDGWASSDKRMFICTKAFEDHPGQKASVQGELGKFE
jgi:hypothetical protein